MAFRAISAAAFLPSVPRFLDGVGPRAPVHVRQVKQFAKTAASRAPALRRIVAEQSSGPAAETNARTSGTRARWNAPKPGRDYPARTPCRRPASALHQSSDCPGSRSAARLPLQHPHDNFHVVLPETVQAQPFARSGASCRRPAPRRSRARPPSPPRPCGTPCDSAPPARATTSRRAAATPFSASLPTVAGLAFDRQSAVRAMRRPQPGEQQPDEMVNLRDRRHRALAAARGCCAARCSPSAEFQ